MRRKDPQKSPASFRVAAKGLKDPARVPGRMREREREGEREREREREKERERESVCGGAGRGPGGPLPVGVAAAFQREREIFIDNLLVRVHLIIEMILVDRPCATGV